MTAPWWQTNPPSAAAPCLPCCAEAPGGCPCALLIPPFAAPYADYATAEDALDGTNLYEVATCYGYFIGNLSVEYSTFTIDVSTANQAGVVADASVGLGFDVWLGLTLAAGATLSIPYVMTITGVPLTYLATFTLYDCSGNVVDTDSDTTASGTLSLSATDEGIYYLKLSFVGGTATPGGSLGITATVSSSVDMIVNPVIAQWDDSGTTRNLWACPKLLLPPLTEFTGDWYADCAAAASVITDQVSNCVGYTESAVIGAGFTATDGGTSLTLAELFGLPASSTDAMWGCVNVEAGETITFTGTTDGGSPDVFADIYDDAGVLVDSVGSGGGGSPVTSIAMPYTGRYTIRTYLVVPPPGSPFTSASVAITSSGAMSVNEIQALYDDSLTCPNRLDCGDSC